MGYPRLGLGERRKAYAGTRNCAEKVLGSVEILRVERLGKKRML